MKWKRIKIPPSWEIRDNACERPNTGPKPVTTVLPAYLLFQLPKVDVAQKMLNGKSQK